MYVSLYFICVWLPKNWNIQSDKDWSFIHVGIFLQNTDNYSNVAKHSALVYNLQCQDYKSSISISVHFYFQLSTHQFTHTDVVHTVTEQCGLLLDLKKQTSQIVSMNWYAVSCVDLTILNAETLPFQNFATYLLTINNQTVNKVLNNFINF